MMFYDGALQEALMSMQDIQTLNRQLVTVRGRKNESLQKDFVSKYKHGDHFSFAVLRFLLGNGKDAAIGKLRCFYQEHIYKQADCKHPPVLSIYETIPEPRQWLEHAPPFSWFLKFRFTLKTPWFSRGETSFSVTDNPLSLDRLTLIPEIKASAWKGLVNSSVYYLYGIEGLPADYFGSASGDDMDREDSRAGSLIFFPSFFKASEGKPLIRSDVITPLDNKKRTAKLGAIHYPVVSEGAAACFCLAFDGTKEFLHYLEKGCCSPALSGDNLEKLGEAISALLLRFGFSAKSSSGYGIAHDNLESCLLLYKDMTGQIGRAAQSEDEVKMSPIGKLHAHPTKHVGQVPGKNMMAADKQNRTLKSLADLGQAIGGKGIPANIPPKGVPVSSLKKQLAYLEEVFQKSNSKGGS